MLTLDHLVIGTSELVAGEKALAQRTGLHFESGGRHEGWGTHNRLLSLGAETYLELIAPDPDQPPPPAPRAFGLDDPAVRARISERPRLLAYVVRTNDIAAARQQLGLPEGEIIAMQRGALRWRLSRPAPGQAAGTPSLIEWGDSPLPGVSLPANALRLRRLRLVVPVDVARALNALRADTRITIESGEQTTLSAELDAAGERIMLD